MKVIVGKEKIMQYETQSPTLKEGQVQLSGYVVYRRNDGNYVPAIVVLEPNDYTVED